MGSIVDVMNLITWFLLEIFSGVLFGKLKYGQNKFGNRKIYVTK